MAGEAQARYMELLGVKPGASVDEIEAAYFAQIEQFHDNPTEAEVERQLKLQHAYAILKRSHAAGALRGSAPTEISRGPGGERWLRGAAVLLLVSLAAVVLMNLPAIRMGLTDYDVGTAVRLKERSSVYGTIVGYEPAHRFHAGSPTPAYQIRLADTGETVWLSKRVVVKGMVPVEGR